MNAPEEVWLRCLVSPGMFEGELGVQGKQYNGAEFALFVSADTVDAGDQPLISGQTVPGFVRVKLIQRQGDLVVVQLPGQTFQNGSFITVMANELETRPQPSMSPA